MQALADIIVTDGLVDFTVQQVADKAGVSHRTVYRYFPGRDELLDAFAEWLDKTVAQSGAPSMVATADELPAAVIANFAAFDQYADLMRAYILISLTTSFRSSGQNWRSQKFRDLIAAKAPNLDQSQRERAFVIIRYLVSSQSWYALREQFNLDGKQAGAMVAWAVRCLLDDLTIHNSAAEGAAKSTPDPPGSTEDRDTQGAE